MKLNFKDIHLGSLIKERVTELNISMIRICNFFSLQEHEIEQMYLTTNLNSDLILKWSKLLEYDFFRIYSQHLIIYSPKSTLLGNETKKQTSLPMFRKNIYTVEMIEFILGQLNSSKMTKLQIIEEYRIPKTTLYKWISKHQ